MNLDQALASAQRMANANGLTYAVCERRTGGSVHIRQIAEVLLVMYKVVHVIKPDGRRDR